MNEYLIIFANRVRVTYNNYRQVTSQLFGQPLLIAVPREECTYDTLYNTLLDKMSRYVRQPEEADGEWWKTKATHNSGNNCGLHFMVHKNKQFWVRPVQNYPGSDKNSSLVQGKLKFQETKSELARFPLGAETYIFIIMFKKTLYLMLIIVFISFSKSRNILFCYK